jgi:hypothetical protein
MGIWDSSNGEYDDFQWQVYNTLGNRLFTLDFDNSNMRVYYLLDGGGNYQDTGVTFSNAATYQLEVIMDPHANRWSAQLGGVTLVSNQPMTTTGQPLGIADVDAVWWVYNPATPGNNYMVFDNYQVVLKPRKNLLNTHFEMIEGFAPSLDLSGQSGWTSVGSGGNGLVTNFFDRMGQSAYLGFDPPATGDSALWIWRPLVVPAIPTNHVIKFSVMMGVWDSDNGRYDDFQWEVYNTLGDNLFTLDFDNNNLHIYYLLDGSSTYQDTGVTFSNEVVYPLEITMDVEANQWSARLGGVTLAANQPITTTGKSLNLADIDAAWRIYNPGSAGNNFMVFDQYRVDLEARSVGPVIRFDSDTAAHTMTLRWAGSGTLQASEFVEGPYSDVPGATSPYTLNNHLGTRFYRVRN